ncbi:hypothetical protein J6590_025939 [Homalodisca vitripennis]|nr:hypothetical protein J6590_025939 [Homalodisca vitripennis]
MRGDSRGAVLTTHTHTLSRSLTIFCPRFGLTRFVPDPVSELDIVAGVRIRMFWWAGHILRKEYSAKTTTILESNAKGRRPLARSKLRLWNKVSKDLRRFGRRKEDEDVETSGLVFWRDKVPHGIL